MEESFFSIATSILMFVLILAFAWWCSRWVGRKYGRAVQGQRLRVLERLRISQDQSLLLVRYKARGFLIGTGSSGIRLLAEVKLDEEDLADQSGTGGTVNE